MPQECAFCPSTAKMSGEHVWSDWMNALFPGEKIFYNKTDRENERVWSGSELDWKVKVVCEDCNNTWMSNLEEQHAKPTMSDLIVGKVDIPIPQSRANSIALFAFKTAVILEHMRRDIPLRFFPRIVRHRFRELLEIPPNVRMWMAGFLPRGKGRCMTLYYDAPVVDSPPLEFYVCNFGVGHFLFQVIAERKPPFLAVGPMHGYEQLAVPFWPRVPHGFMWPPEHVLKTTRDFEQFSMRWRRLNLANLTGGD
jgi:hypothetical protein